MSQRSAKQIWEVALGQLQIQLTRANYDTWLKDTVGIDYDDTRFVIGVPGPFAAEWLENRLLSLVKKTLIDIVGHDTQVIFKVHNGQREEASATSNSSGNHPLNSRPTAVRINPRYTFDSFVVGNSNRLAHAAAMAVAENPGRGYNPLFIYAGVGLGKTHLLHAIGHVTIQKSLKVLYVSSEQFTNEFINAIRERKTEEFRNKYRNVDVLLIDDIHFISGKEQTQEGFFHTFNDLHNANRQIVITSDRPPKSMPLLEDRLRSRFEWGLIADIQPPDLETRLAILKAKTEGQGVAIPDPVLEFIARRVQKNIRELEGCLNRVVAYARLAPETLTPELAAQALQDVAPSGVSRRITPSLVLAAVANYFHIAPELLQSKRRNKDIALARQIAMYLIREELHLPYTEIGKQLGGRGHVTILYGCEKIASEINTNPQLRQDVLEIREALYSKADKSST